MRPFAAAVLLAVSAPAWAQSHPAPTSFLAEDTIIVAGTAGQFEPAQQSWCASAIRAGGAPACLVFSSALFGDANRYLTLIPFGSFAHFDQGKYNPSGLSLEEEHALTPAPAAHTTQSVLTLVPDLSFSHIPPNDRPLTLFTEYTLRPGTLDAFLALARTTLLPLARKSALPSFQVFTTAVGANQDRVLVVTRLDSFSQLDHLPLTPDSAPWQDFQSRAIAATTTSLLRYRPDLSANPTDPTP